MMRAARLRGLRAAAVLAVVATLGLLALGSAEQAQATTYTSIVGAGSTYAYPALNQWATNLESQGLSISYTPNGSAEGRQWYISNQVDFAGTDIAFLTAGDADPFTGVDIQHISFAYSYVPDVGGGLSFLYNLQVGGRQIRNMRLSGLTLEKIFTGQITNWDNPEITQEYGEQLPSIPITVVTRSDGSGESYFLTNWFLDGLGQQGRSMWVNYCEARGGGSLCASDPTELYPALPTFKRLDGASSVAGYVESSVNNGAIGYAEYAYAIPDDIPVVSVANDGGYYEQPTAANVAVSLHAAIINEDPSSVNFLMQNLTPVYTDTDPRTYPLSSYSYLIVPRTSRTINGVTYTPHGYSSADGGATLSKYVGYILCQAQQSAAALGYSPLPKPMVQGGFLQYNYIPGALPPPQGNNYNNCDNPAYHDGVDTILADAPMPNKCQKVTAPLNCNPSAPGDGATTADDNGSGNGKGKGSGGTTGSNGDTTGPSNGATGATDSNVYAQPVGLAGQPAEQWLFGVLTALELIAVVVVPVVLGTWLQRRRRGGGGGGGLGPLGRAG
jgi:ABC-type phosphate transport system substrate-binding protein